MKLYFLKTYSDEEGTAEEANSAMIYSSKEELIKICDFFAEVKKHIEKNDTCHMHLCDNYEGWQKGENFDLEINIE